ncbi:4'-phosphopantetheinyl transferase family protein [Streptomyces sp. DT24]|uniref:4'-phosphopantetheinyl transferase family protein n=1 Tax=unclassified Streptomyces TaxID=2593676 RepID=UPI0023B910D7|nr:4'-phosphopantetheinyl transferase superfamily protein [Streptomyces sp. AM 4-1-1]WEH32309.1 4'-phosphopantetheinyl transferase superfamily protein [Streptomyces sp. AM 4-1-1]
MIDSLFMDGRPGSAPDNVTVLWCGTDGDERRRARTLLVRAAAELLDVPAAEVWLEHEPGGRPFLGGAGTALRVSVAHARGALAVALTTAFPVGVDVEVVRRLRADAMARAWLDPVEADWVAALPEADRSAAFLWLWTQKEAVGKALGQGLRGGGMSRSMPLPEHWPPVAGEPAVPRPLPGAPDLASAAVGVGGGRHIIGVALHGTDGAVPSRAGVRVCVREVSPAP